MTDEKEYLPAMAGDTAAPAPHATPTDEKLEKEEAQQDGLDTESLSRDSVIETGDDVSRLVVSARDDGDPALAFPFRSLVMGTVLTVLSSVISILYLFKPVQVTVSSVFLILIAFVWGQAWAHLTPSPARLSGTRFAFLQGLFRFLNFGQPFGIKEHTVAVLLASCSNNSASGIETIAIEKLFYNRSPDALTTVMGLFAVSLCGFVLAGVFRTTTIYPSDCVYWSTLPMVSLLQALHFDLSGASENKKRVTFFGKALVVSSLYELLPAYIAPVLNGVSAICWSSPAIKNDGAKATVTHLFGGANSNEGLGVLNFSFDWQYLTSSAMALPLNQQANAWIGVLLMYAVFSAVYWGDAFGAKSMGLPMLSSSFFNSDGTRYKLSAILDEKLDVNYEALAQVGLPRLTAITVVGFTCQTLAIGALLSHVLIFYRKRLLTAVRERREGTETDPHILGMQKYADVPLWAYGILAALAFFAGLIAVLHGQTTLPVWAYIVALLLGGIIAPFSMSLYARLGDGVGTNALSKMIGGVLVPGRPLAVLWFNSWSHQVILLAVNLANWLKIAQYIKVPFRVMFVTQIYGTLLAAAVNYLVADLVVNAQREILLDPQGNNVWSGATLQSLNSQAVTWALARQVYGLSGYWQVPFGLLIGFALPPVHWLLEQAFPGLQNLGFEIITPMILQHAGANSFAGAFSYIGSTVVVGVISQVWVRRRYPRWFAKRSYLLGAGLDGGSQITIFILSFAVYGAAGIARPFPSWWGNATTGNVDHCNLPSA